MLAFPRMARGPSRWGLALAIGAFCGGGSCGSDAVQTYTVAYARAYCGRVFACCNAADLASLTPAPDEAACEKTVTTVGLGNIEQAIADGLVRFDAAAGQRCLADLQQACDVIFDPKLGRLLPCEDVYPGAVPLGGACDDDFVCASDDCEEQMCAVRGGCATLACAPDHFCGSLVAGCQPRVGLGEPCPTGVECDATLTCTAGACAAPLADGQPCASPFDCAGSCTVNTAAAPTGTCRPGLCQGP